MIRYIYIILLCSTIISCEPADFFSLRKGEVKNSVFINAKKNTDGSIHFHTATHFGASNQQVGDHYSFFANLLVNDAKLSMGLLHLNDITFSQDHQGSYYAYEMRKNNKMGELFGDTVIFTLEGNNNVEVTKHSLYIPQEIQLSAPIHQSDTSLQPLSRNGDIVKWNMDAKNEIGVAIIIRWSGMINDPSVSYLDNHLIKENVANYEIVKDDGEHILDASFFDNIPKNAIITLEVYRGNCEIIKTNGYNIKLGGYSESNSFYLLSE